MADKLEKLIRDNVNPLTVVIHLSRKQTKDLVDRVTSLYIETFPDEFEGFNGVSLYHNIHGTRKAVADELESYSKYVKSYESFSTSDRFDEALARIKIGYSKKVEHLKIGKETTDNELEKSAKKIKNHVKRAMALTCDKIEKAEDKRNPDQTKISKYVEWLEQSVIYARKSINKRIEKTTNERERVVEKDKNWREKVREREPIYGTEHHHQRRDRSKWTR
jgi:hypothetical protein